MSPTKKKSSGPQKAYTFRGKTQSLPRWAAELRIPESTLRSRLGKLGQPVEVAFAAPPDARFHPAPAPPPPAVPAPPPLERHPTRGFGRARWTEHGRRREATFGAFGSPACAAAYARFCAEWYAQRGAVAPPPGEAVSVAGLILRYTEYADGHFRKRGRPTSETHGVRAALKRVNAVYGDTPAAAFGPQQLRAVVAGMVAEGLSLKTVNDYRARVVRLFVWAAGRSLVPSGVPAALALVEAEVPGRSEAPVYAPVTSAPDADVAAVLPHLHPDPARCRVLADLVRALRLTGMRPGEGCGLQGGEVDRSREPWLYTPASKTEHFGKPRRVWIGPKGRELLGPLLDAAGDGFVFTVARRRGEGAVRVSEAFLRACLAAACGRAKVPPFAPNQLRHARATEVHDRYEDDAAVAAALGNSPEVARQVYVDHPADRVAKRIAEETG